jgi:hypothetical protein
MVQILWFNMSMIPYYCKFWIQILEMPNKFLPHIIFNKWTFINLMSNLMAICATWRIWFWNFIHIVNPSTIIPWNSYNYAFIILIKSGFTIPHFYSQRNTYYYWFTLGKTIVFSLVTSIDSTPSDIFIP